MLEPHEYFDHTGVWTNRNNGLSNANSINSQGFFTDILTVGGFPTSNAPDSALQSFYAVGAFFDMPLTIQWNGSSYAILGNYYQSNLVFVNGSNPAGSCK